MNLNLQTYLCDSDRLESFLNGELSDAQEREFASHLNRCENCRRSLEQQAAEPESWIEAAKLLQPSKFDSLNADEASDSGMVERSTRQPLQIQNVLDALGPTDDPEMLGRLGGYEVSGVVGAGGMGVVLKAIDKSLDRTVAIKVLAPHLATSGAARKRFAREAKATAAVLHPNVIAIHSVSNDESLPYLVMPYVRGTSLQKRLDREGPLSLNEILRIGSQIAAGLAAAHAQGLVHRDIKPANILLEDGVERVTITDFGLARAVDDATITHSGVIAGTPQYMSPEQARGEAVEQRSDLFSLGSVLYAICTGRPPFRAETTYGVTRRITDDEPTSIREINSDVPDWLCSIIARLMSKRAGDRFESAAEVTELLEKCLAHVQQPAAVPLPASLVPRAAHRHWIFNSSRKGVLAMLATFGIGLLGVVLLSAAPPDIAGEWSGDEWGQVVLKKTDDAKYTGTYSDTFGKQPGEIQLKWSRMEGRFNGTWREGEDRFGKLSVRLVGDEIRGALRTDPKSKINPGTPRLADLTWKRPGSSPQTSRIEMGALSHRVPFEVGATSLRDGDRITIDEVRGTTDTMKAGNMYEIRGTYRLASQGKATLAAYITDDGTAEKAQRQGTVPTQKTQSMTVERGEGKFALIFYMWHDGKPHVSLYPESGGKGFGHVYFGTGDSVLKKGWWEAPRNREADSPPKTTAIPRRLNYFTTGHDIRVACSADGQRIAVANGNPTFPLADDWKPSVQILDAGTGKTVVSLKLTTNDEDTLLAETKREPHFEVEALAFSPEGNVVAVGTSIGQVKLFHARTGELVRSLDDEPAKLADKKTPEKLKSLARAMGGVASMAFSPDGNLLALCGGAIGEGSLVFDEVRRLGRSVTGPGRLKVWDVKTGMLKHDLVGHSHANAVSFSSDGNLLASAGSWEDGREHGNGAIIWNPQTGAKIRTFPTNTNGGTWSVAFSPNSKLVAISSRTFDKDNDTSTSTISLTRVGTGILEWRQTIPGWGQPVVFSPDGNSVAVLCGGHSIQWIDAETGVMKYEIKSADFLPSNPRQGGRWNTFAIAPQGPRLAIGGVDREQKGSVELWDFDGLGTATTSALGEGR